MSNDIYMDYLKKYYEEYGTINDIMSGHTVEVDGKALDIYEFIKKIRYNHKKYISGKTDRGVASKLSLSRYEQLDQMGYDWSTHPPRIKNDPYNDKEILYLRKHFQEYGTINNIGIHDIVEYEGKPLKIGQFLMSIRAKHNYFLQGNSRNQSMTELSKARYQILEEMNIDWTPQWNNTYDILNNDICLEYLKHHFEQNGTINDIYIDDIVTYKEQELKIGYFVATSRRRYKDYLVGKRTNECSNEIFLKRYDTLNSLGLVWDVPKDRLENDLYLEYLKEHYQKHGTINNIISSTEVEYNGRILCIGTFLARMRSQYNQYQKDPNCKENSTPLLLQRYKELTKLEFDWTLTQRNNGIVDFARKNDFDVKQISKFTSMFNGNVSKAFKIRLLQEKLKQNKPLNRYRNCLVKDIIKSFNLNLEQFVSNLNRDNIRLGPISTSIAYSNEMTLEEFCARNNYRYRILAIAACLKLDNLCDEPLESLLNRSLTDYQKDKHTKPSTWIYSKYGNDKLLKQKINAAGLKSPEVLLEMSNECISLEHAFANVIFRKNRKESYYVKGIFLELVKFYEEKNSRGISKDSIERGLKKEIKSLTEEYSLTEQELSVIKKSLTEYKTAIHQYRIYDVAFEHNKDKRREKILAYNFDLEDIKKAFFAPLQFDGRKLIGRDHELYNRRHLLISLGTSWDKTSLEEKKQLVKEYKLKRKEVECLEETTQEIAIAKKLVKK